MKSEAWDRNNSEDVKNKAVGPELLHRYQNLLKLMQGCSTYSEWCNVCPRLSTTKDGEAELYAGMLRRGEHP